MVMEGMEKFEFRISDFFFLLVLGIIMEKVKGLDLFI